MNIAQDVEMTFPVFEVNYDNKQYYCCWSGGEIRNGEPFFTPAGQAALEALLELSTGRNDKIHIQEIKLDEMPLKSKIKKVFKKAGMNTKICFIGDIEGELDAHLPQAFNLVTGTIKINP